MLTSVIDDQEIQITVGEYRMLMNQHESMIRELEETIARNCTNYEQNLNTLAAENNELRKYTAIADYVDTNIILALMVLNVNPNRPSQHKPLWDQITTTINYSKGRIEAIKNIRQNVKESTGKTLGLTEAVQIITAYFAKRGYMTNHEIDLFYASTR